VTAETIVFAGPSIHGLSPPPSAELSIRRPASCGDILTATLAGAKRIGLIDGVFGGATAVWHKEILHALQAGVAVFGSSSMGALRAAECAGFGMIGIGEIFADYAAGRRFADADVAVLHAPAEFDFRPLTVALVDAEASIEEAYRADALPRAIYERLLFCATSMHFSKRTWPDVIAAATQSAAEASIARSAIERFERSVKREDAALLLQGLRRFTEGDAPPTPAFTFARSVFFDALERRVVGQSLKRPRV